METRVSWIDNHAPRYHRGSVLYPSFITLVMLPVRKPSPIGSNQFKALECKDASSSINWHWHSGRKIPFALSFGWKPNNPWKQAKRNPKESVQFGGKFIPLCVSNNQPIFSLNCSWRMFCWLPFRCSFFFYFIRFGERVSLFANGILLASKFDTHLWWWLLIVEGERSPNWVLRWIVARWVREWGETCWCRRWQLMRWFYFPACYCVDRSKNAVRWHHWWDRIWKLTSIGIILGNVK